MKKSFLILTIVLLASMLLAMPASAAKKQPPSGLTPGQYTEYTQTVPVNLVFIGYSPAVIDSAALVNMLPKTYEPVVRYPEMYGIDGRRMGLHFDFTYRPIFSNKKFDDKFFKYLTRIGQPGEPTEYQLAYNGMAGNVQDVTGPVLYLDAPSVEKYLAKQARSLGIKKSQSGLLFFRHV